VVRKKVTIVWDEEAKKSLRSIYDYIKNRESVEVAKRIRAETLKQVATLIIFPEKFEQEPHLKNEKGNYRYKVVWSYKIIYEVTPKTLYILDIFHTSRDPSNLVELTKE
jgi:plasmid stabilization system protein ParE